MSGPPTAELTPPPSAEMNPTLPLSAVHSMSHDGENENENEKAFVPSQHPSPGKTGSSGSLSSMKLTGTPKPGDIIFDRYQIVRELGGGGMGVVLLVNHLGLNSERALKLIMADIAADDQIRARFKREARVMAKLTHPNAVTVHDSKLAKDAAFIEMEYVRGQSLNRVLRPGQPMPLDWVARILEQLCDVLQEAHSLGIVHRDLKPSNLMLVEGRPVGREFLKVLDFGIAKLLKNEGMEGDDIKTMTNMFIGTAHYSSPEQIRGSQVDARSDLYSTGVLLYEFLTGQRPFSGSPQMLICDHLSTAPLPFAVKDPQTTVPPEVERMVLRCLAKDAEDRPQSANELAREFLQAVASGTTRKTSVEHRPSGANPRAEPAPKVLQPTAPKPQAEAGAKKPLFAPAPPANLPKPSGKTPSSAASGSKKPPKRGWSMLAKAVVLAGLLVGGIGAFFAWMSYNKPDKVEEVVQPSPTDPLCYRPADSANLKILAWIRAGFLPVKADCTNAAGWPNTLAKVHAATGATLLYRLSSTGHYLPDGYAPDGDELAADGWPKILVRASDKTRFIRIVGGRFPWDVWEARRRRPTI